MKKKTSGPRIPAGRRFGDNSMLWSCKAADVSLGLFLGEENPVEESKRTRIVSVVTNYWDLGDAFPRCWVLVGDSLLKLAIDETELLYVP